MNHNRKWLAAAGSSIALAFAALAVSADPGMPGEGKGRGAHAGKHHGMHDKGAMDKHAHGLMTLEERNTMRDKMRAANTPEERQQIAAANRAEMQKRAAEKGITLPEHRGPRGRGPAAPATGQHTH